jgi:hypothetical protein
MMRRRRGPALAGCVGLLMLLEACRFGLVPKVEYRLPSAVTVPVGARVTDASVAFAKTFCATLTHLDPTHAKWGSCAQYLEAPTSEQPAPTDPIPKDLGIIIVGGAFSHCFERKHVLAFGPARSHLSAQLPGDHALSVEPIQIGGVASPDANAAAIDAYLASHPGDYIAIGHSKGAVDLMTSVQKYPAERFPHARAQIKALVSIAGAISGSRLADLGEGLTIFGFKRAVKKSGLGNCDIKEEGGIRSLRRDVRYEFLRSWEPPMGLKTYSIVGVVNRDETSSVLHMMWDRLELYSNDQDSQMIAEEAIIPGAQFLGVAKGDHWALALPFTEHHDPKINKAVSKNRFPRTALLEAIIRYVHATR